MAQISSEGLPYPDQDSNNSNNPSSDTDERIVNNDIKEIDLQPEVPIETFGNSAYGTADVSESPDPNFPAYYLPAETHDDYEPTNNYHLIHDYNYNESKIDAGNDY